MTPEELSKTIKKSLESLISAKKIAVNDIPEIKIERPKSKDHGDYASNIALMVAKPAGVNPREVAQLLVDELSKNSAFKKVEIAGPGFLNFTLESASLGEVVRTIIKEANKYGHTNTLQGQNINVEFISANPTGPLHLGHTRWAAVGDALARVLVASGAKVAREFYINDRGTQIDKFGISICAAANNEAIPEDGYHGAYIKDLATEIVKEKPEILKLSKDKQVIEFREEGYKKQLKQQQSVLDDFRTHFDVWYSERSLHSSGAVEKGLAVLKKHGHVFELEGATWLKTTDFGDDKDRVLIKADGEYTYFASDTAYYVDKRSRGFDVNIYLLGADHHGYVNRLRAVSACAGDDPDKNVEVLIGQLVKMLKNGQEVRLSKRAGNIITLEDLVDEVGVDAARYTLTRYPVETSLTLDIDLLTSHTNDNPVFYVQYAHARISAVLRAAVEKGIDWQKNTFNPAVLITSQEAELLGALSEFPRIVAASAQLREPHRVARYLEELATAYHSFYSACRVLPMDGELVTDVTNARLLLCAATRQVVRNGLDLLGVGAPEKM
ncbi:MAG: arginine--tRNA ligase [Candidatus Nanopelagicales bacterium]|nr:arginine--tRNA ligase [Candidatus Nanopelagicales bacterium]